MTVSAAPALAGPFDGNDAATSFPFDFKIFADSDLRVVLRDTLTAEYLLTLDVDYSVSMNPDQNADPGGSISYPLSGSPLATGERLTISTGLQLSQQTVFTNLGKFFPATVEDTFDRLTMLLRQIQAESVRAIRVPVSLSDVLTDLPTPVAGAALVWNEDGTALVNGVPTESLIAISSFMANVIQAVDAAEARSDIGAAADADVVKLTGDQTIAGVKTFSSPPIIPNAAAAQNPVSKTQLDAETAARTAAIAAAVLPSTLAPTLFVETTPKALNGLAAVEWTGLPSWVRQIVIVISAQSGTTTGIGGVRIGTGGAAETSGYSGAAAVVFGTTAGGNNSTYWRLTDNASASAAAIHSHRVTITKVTGNTWLYDMVGATDAGNGVLFGGGTKALAGGLDMVQVLMSSGNFDGGTATLYYR